MAPNTRETDAIVLDIHPHGESDLIITLFCRDRGRSTAIAKGARKSKRRFVNKLELFSFLHVSLRQSSGRSLSLLEEADLHTGFLELRKGLTRYTAASVLQEFILLATRENEEDTRIYGLLLWSLHQLNSNLPHLQVVTLFLLRFYDYIGYRPEFDHCFQCGSGHSRQTAMVFSTATGGVFCQRCAANVSQSGIQLSQRTIRTLNSCQDAPLERLHRIRISQSSLYESLNMLHRYGRHILQRDIISWPMLRETLNPTELPWPAQR